MNTSSRPASGDVSEQLMWLTSAMLALARTGDWQAVAEAEARRASLLHGPLQAHGPQDGGQAGPWQALLRAQREIEARVEAARDDAACELASLRARRLAVRRYAELEAAP